jgi:hypothetical protein
VFARDVGVLAPDDPVLDLLERRTRWSERRTRA